MKSQVGTDFQHLQQVSTALAQWTKKELVLWASAISERVNKRQFRLNHIWGQRNCHVGPQISILDNEVQNMQAQLQEIFKQIYNLTTEVDVFDGLIQNWRGVLDTQAENLGKAQNIITVGVQGMLDRIAQMEGKVQNPSEPSHWD